MFVGLRYNNRGHYACLFCTHKSWKGETAAETHVTNKHPAERAKLLAKKLQEVQDKPPRIEYKERIVYRDKPDTDEYQKERISIYCTNCCVVMQGVRLPKGHSINNTSCSYCNTVSLKMVTKII